MYSVQSDGSSFPVGIGHGHHVRESLLAKEGGTPVG